MIQTFLRTLLVVGVLATGSPAFAQTPPPEWGSAVLNRPADWYGTTEAQALADAVVLHQSAEGGWPKNTSLAVPPDAAPVDPRSQNTFDNQATTLPMAFLARVIHAGGRPGDRQTFDRGLDYILAAQYPNGGWPQFYPLREGYWSRITFNDDAMVRILVLLRDIASGAGPYEFVDSAQRARAAQAVDRGIQLILDAQIRQNGARTVWSAQHDERTLEPAWARAYEPPSLSGNESVGVVRFLMSVPDPSPEVIAAVEGAVAWLRDAALTGVRFESIVDADGVSDAGLVQDPSAGPLWARFYELETNRPIFLDRNSVVHYDIAGIERERRTGYRYYGDWPLKLIRDDYPRWRRRIGRPLEPAAN